MKITALPLAFASVLAVASFPTVAGAADPKTNATVEAADRQFLANLEGSAAIDPVPVTETQRPTPAPAPTVPKVVTSTTKKSSDRTPTVKHLATARKTEPVEIRRAVPVTIVTTTTTSQVDRDRDEDDDDHDRDRDKDEDHGNGFFHRLFRGEKAFR